MSNLSSIILAGHSVPREICFTAAWQHACRLADAAPKLLEACRAVVERWECGDLAEATRMCAAAIAKAEWRQA